MPPIVEKFLKITASEDQANQVAMDHLAAGAISSVVTETNESFLVTTVLPAPADDDPAPSFAAITNAAGAETHAGTLAARPLDAAAERRRGTDGRQA